MKPKDIAEQLLGPITEWQLFTGTDYVLTNSTKFPGMTQASIDVEAGTLTVEKVDPDLDDFTNGDGVVKKEVYAIKATLESIDPS